jgi:hypothetical protein
VRVGMEATGYSLWFERLLAELGFELWIGDSADIKASSSPPIALRGQIVAGSGLPGKGSGGRGGSGSGSGSLGSSGRFGGSSG